MGIAKWKVDNWGNKPTCVEYAKQTACFYVFANGRRDSISSLYHRFFDTEAEALRAITDRNAKRARDKEIDQIKRHAVELLEALESLMLNYPFPDSVYADNARIAIAKAKGEQQ